MNWLRDTAGPQDASPPVASSDPAKLRAQAAAATGEDRNRLERELGRACGASGTTPSPQDSPCVWAEAACHAGDKLTADVWLSRVSGDEWLAQVATHSRFADVRLAAARRLTRPTALKQVADASREKDKLVYRHCSDALRAHRDSGERARRAPDLALALQALLDAQPIALTHLLEIEKEIDAFGADSAELTGCTALLRRAQARVLEEAQAQIDVRDRLQAAQQLAAELAAASAASADQQDAWQSLHQDLLQADEPVAAWLARLPLAKELEKALKDIAASLAALGDARVAAQRAAELAAQQAELPAPAADAAAPAAAPPEKPAAPRRKIDSAALQVALGELDLHLGQGKLADAEAAASRIDHSLAGQTLTGPLAGRLARSRAQLTELRGWARWGTDQARDKLIAEAEALLAGNPDLEQRALAVPAMRNEWKRLDSGGAAKKALWERFDALMGKTFAPVVEKRAADALRHKAARAAKLALCAELEAWLAQHAALAPRLKKADAKAPTAVDAAAADATATDSTAADATAADAATADAIVPNSNAPQVATADIKPEDFKALEAKRDEVMVQWRAAGMAGFGDERKLRKRLDTLLLRIDAPLKQARAAELARRKELVLAAEALRDAPDVGQGISAAKALQARWKNEALPVPLRHGGEQKLWQRFRAACDAVFARRDAERAGQIAERTQRVEAEKAKYAEFEATLAGDDAATLQAALTAFRTAQGADRPAPAPSEERGDARGRRDSGIGTRGRGPVKPDPNKPVEAPRAPVDPRALELIRRAEQRIEALREAKREARFGVMAQKAALAETIEAAASAAAPTEDIAVQARASWDALPRLSADAEKRLAARLDSATAATGAELARGNESRDALLLDLEIALDLESPAAQAEARRARTLSRLQNRFRGEDAATQDPEAMVVRWYALPAAPDAAQAARMEAIVRRVIQRSREPKPREPVQTFAPPRRERSERRDERPGRRR